MDVQAFLDTLPIMAKGMAGIFIVTALIIISTLLLNRLAKEKAGKDKD